MCGSASILSMRVPSFAPDEGNGHTQTSRELLDAKSKSTTTQAPAPPLCCKLLHVAERKNLSPPKGAFRRRAKWAATEVRSSILGASSPYTLHT